VDHLDAGLLLEQLDGPGLVGAVALPVQDMQLAIGLGLRNAEHRPRQRRGDGAQQHPSVDHLPALSII
jgi:hypothetical protein